MCFALKICRNPQYEIYMGLNYGKSIHSLISNVNFEINCIKYKLTELFQVSNKHFNRSNRVKTK